jgi:hypothetical protein
MKLEVIRNPPREAALRDNMEKFHEDVERMQEALSWFQSELTLLQQRLSALMNSPSRRNG